MRISDWSSDVCSSDLLRQTTNPATLGFNFPGLPKLIGPYSVFDARIKASQKLIDFAAAAELSGAEFGARAAAAQADASREAIASRAALAYIQVLGNEQMLASAHTALGLPHDLLTLSREPQKAGITSGGHAPRAETDRKEGV